MKDDQREVIQEVVHRKDDYFENDKSKTPRKKLKLILNSQEGYYPQS